MRLINIAKKFYRHLTQPSALTRWVRANAQ
jgi:hypothetical protein